MLCYVFLIVVSSLHSSFVVRFSTEKNGLFETGTTVQSTSNLSSSTSTLPANYQPPSGFPLYCTCVTRNGCCATRRNKKFKYVFRKQIIATCNAVISSPYAWTSYAALVQPNCNILARNVNNEYNISLPGWKGRYCRGYMYTIRTEGIQNCKFTFHRWKTKFFFHLWKLNFCLFDMLWAWYNLIISGQ